MVAQKIWASAGILLSFVAVVAVSASAVFTDSASSAGNGFSTGSVAISTNPSTAMFSVTNMAPGDQVTAPITVSNDGSLELRYALTGLVTATTGNAALAQQLDLSIKENVTVCDDTGFGTDGTTVYGPGDVANALAINLLGDPTQGAHTGDRVLAAAVNETLCFNVALPLSTTSDYESSSTTATFTFDAEQTKNNS